MSDNPIDAPVDVEQVTHMPGYRVGFLPPVPGSLAAGEMYLELSPPDAPGVPTLWIGLPDYLAVEGNLVQLASVPGGAAASKAKAPPPDDKKKG